MKSKRRSQLISILIHLILLIIVTIIYMLPFVWMVSTSFKSDQELYEYPAPLLPDKLMFENYKYGLTYFPFFKYLRNSIIVTAGSVIGVLFSCPLAAYSFAQLKWKGRDIIFYSLIATMMLPNFVTLIPLFVIFSKLNLVNTFWPLILPSFLGQPFFIFLLRQFFLSLPTSLFDAARVDGASEFQIYTKIALPLTKPALLVVGLFQFLASWNDYLGPLIYLTDENKYTLSLGLPQFLNQYGTHWNWMMAVSTVVVVPVLIFFIFTQKQLIEGIKFSGSKG